MLFSENEKPLWSKLRPQNMEHFSDTSGLREVFDSFIKSPFSLILHGPPGSGKTTFAEILIRECRMPFFTVAATSVSLDELRKIAEKEKRRYILFMDEIHRFAKTRQDYLLKPIEDGQLILVGATTESPWYYLTKPLLSRLTVKKISIPDYNTFSSIIREALISNGIPGIPNEALTLILRQTWPDFRKAYSAIEHCISLHLMNTPLNEIIERLTIYFHENRLRSAHSDTQEYDLLSAFIKSIRGSDPDSAILYLSKMLDIGAEPMGIARRLVILSSEDVGLANNHGVVVASSILHAVEKTGMPEARILLAHATLYLSLSPKSNSAYKAIEKAMELTTDRILEIPDYLKNHPVDKLAYLYPHDFHGYVPQNYYPLNLEKTEIYTPSSGGNSMEDKLVDNWKLFRKEKPPT